MGSLSSSSRLICWLQIRHMNFSYKYRKESLISYAVCSHKVSLQYYNNQYPARSTIFALSTPSGLSALAVIRISGPNASDVLYRIGKLQKLPNARKAVLCKVRDPQTDELLDKALALWFPSPNSFTGENVCELHIHGGVAVVKSVLIALQKLPHFRVAEPGEFTKRAFLAGKLDLTEVEGLSDLLHAETEAQQKQALRQMEGVLYKLYSNWTKSIMKCMARLEAYVDFSEDQNLDSTIFEEVTKDIGSLKLEISKHLSDKRRGEKLRSGVFCVLIGRPNVGKSSLLNKLCQRDIAIVSSAAGTTRDIIESSLNLGGYLIHISDTAGIRETCDSVEREGVERAKNRSSKADMLIFIVEAESLLGITDLLKLQKTELVKYLVTKELGQDFFQYLFNFREATYDSSSVLLEKEINNILILVNKIDLLCEADAEKVKQLENIDSSICVISCTEGTGVDNFIDIFSSQVKELCCGHRGEEPTITQERHRHYVEKCLQSLTEFEDYLDYDIAIAAYKLRIAMDELAKITGKITSDDILDIIFREFCIGK